MAGLLDRLTDCYSGLAEGRQRVAKCIIDHPGPAAFLSISELAERASVHQSTVTRFAQELGYRGFPHLQAELRARLTPSAQIERTLGAAGSSESFVDRQIAADTSTLEAARGMISPEHLETAAAWLHAARRVILVGTGVSAAVVSFLDFRFRRLEIEVASVTHGGYELERVIGLDDRDVLLAVGFFRGHQEVLAALDYAREVGARTLAITDSPVSRLALRADLSLMAPRGPAHELNSLVVPMSVANALVLAVAAKRRTASGSMGTPLEKLRSIQKRLREDT